MAVSTGDTATSCTTPSGSCKHFSDIQMDNLNEGSCDARDLLGSVHEQLANILYCETTITHKISFWRKKIITICKKFFFSQ